MKTPSAIPRALGKFDSYIKAVKVDLTTLIGPEPPPPQIMKGETLGLSAGQIAVVVSDELEWSGPNGNNGVWALHESDVTRTPAVTKRVKEIMSGFRTSFNPCLDILCANPNYGAAEELLYGRKRRVSKKKPAKKTGKIDEICYGIFEPIGGKRYRVKNKTATHLGEAALADGATGVGYAYSIVPMVIEPVEPPQKTEPPMPGGNPPAEEKPVVNNGPVTADDCRYTASLSGATHILEPKGAIAKYDLHIFERWEDYYHPERNGPWGNKQIIPL